MQERAASESKPDETPADAAQYIATLAGELAQIARTHKLESLGYILEMARLEADQVAKASDPLRRYA